MSISVNPAAMKELMKDIPVGDIILFEQSTGHTFSSLASLQTAMQRAEEGGALDVPFVVMLGMAWLMKRRSDPGVTWDQAQAWTLEEFQSVMDPISAAQLQPLDTPKRRGAKAASKT